MGVSFCTDLRGFEPPSSLSWVIRWDSLPMLSLHGPWTPRASLCSSVKWEGALPHSHLRGCLWAPGVKAYSGRHKCSQGDKRGQRQGHRGRRCPHQPSGGVTHKGQRVEATQCPRALEVVEKTFHVSSTPIYPLASGGEM